MRTKNEGITALIFYDLLFSFKNIKTCLFSAVYAHRLNMYRCNRYDLCSVLRIKVLKIGKVLEIVGVYFSAVNNIVRLNIIGKFLNVKRYILFLKNLLCNRKYFGVGCGRSRNRNFSAGKLSLIHR